MYIALQKIGALKELITQRQLPDNMVKQIMYGIEGLSLQNDQVCLFNYLRSIIRILFSGHKPL